MQLGLDPWLWNMLELTRRVSRVVASELYITADFQASSAPGLRLAKGPPPQRCTGASTTVNTALLGSVISNET